jgi:hypothetical protein
MKILIIILTVLLLSFSSCKEECKECFLEETNTQTGDTITTSLGKKCGDDLKNNDGREYIGKDGPAKSYCKN